MEIKGKYKVEIKDKGIVVNTFETENIIVDGGLQHVADWMRHDTFSDGHFPALEEIDLTGMTIVQAGFTNPGNAVDGSPSSYTTATINSTTWGNDYWQIDLGQEEDIIAIYIDWSEDDTDYAADYKFQYSADGATWTDIPTRLRPPQESNVRGKVLFFVNEAPPFSTITTRYVRLTTKRGNNDENFYIYEIKLFKQNFCAAAPGVLQLGTGSMTPPPSGGELSLKNSIISKIVNHTVQPSGYITRFIASIGPDEIGGEQITEAGMFFGNSGYSKPNINDSNMFSRGIFEPSGWLKPEGQTADIYYDISISNG